MFVCWVGFFNQQQGRQKYFFKWENIDQLSHSASAVITLPAGQLHATRDNRATLPASPRGIDKTIVFLVKRIVVLSSKILPSRKV